MLESCYVHLYICFRYHEYSNMKPLSLKYTACRPLYCQIVRNSNKALPKGEVSSQGVERQTTACILGLRGIYSPAYGLGKPSLSQPLYQSHSTLSSGKYRILLFTQSWYVSTLSNAAVSYWQVYNRILLLKLCLWPVERPQDIHNHLSFDQILLLIKVSRIGK